jgi:ABC-type Na+ transport system ATPase subunit NatA
MSTFFLLSLCVLIAFYMVGAGNAAVFIGTSETTICMLLLVVLYGASAIPLNYIYSFAFDNYSTAQIMIILLNFMTGFVLVLAHYVMGVTPQLQLMSKVLVHIFRFFPGYNLGEGLINLTTIYLENSIRGEHHHAFGWDVTGRSLVFMLLEAIGYFSVVLLSESRVVRMMMAQYELRRVARYGADPAGLVNSEPDEDVVCEEKKVSAYLDALHMLQQCDQQQVGYDNSSLPSQQDGCEVHDMRYWSSVAGREQLHRCRTKVQRLSLLIDHLEKVYVPTGLRWRGGKAKYAVRGISLACEEGERFGLLGVNGAGKTTTLSILTGESVASSGEIYVGNEPLSNTLTQRRLGYCPQVDPLLELLTAYETLYFFGRIRGVSEGVLERRVQSLIKQTGLLPHAHRPCGTYSGGNKRKLSLAVALIGDPKVLLLDEVSNDRMLVHIYSMITGIIVSLHM